MPGLELSSKILLEALLGPISGFPLAHVTGQ